MADCNTALIISPTFYPHPLVGAVRATQFCRHLPEFGWKPVVLCRYYGYRATAEGLAADVNPTVDLRYLNSPGEPTEVESVASLEKGATKFTKWRTLVKRAITRSVGQMVVPDMSIGFWRGVRQQVVEAVKEVQPSVLFTTGPPHAIHDLGLYLAMKFPNMPWVADFRDPYTLSPGYRPKGIYAFRFQAHRRYEHKIYATCQLALHVNELHDRWARLQFPDYRSKMHYLPNGIPNELTAAQPVRKERSRIVFCSVGVGGEEETLTVARALLQLLDEGVDAEFRMIGPYPNNLDLLREILGDRLNAMGRLEHKAALSQMLDADVLISTQSLERAALVGLSSKLLEYLATGYPLIVVNNSRPARLFLQQFIGVFSVDRPTVSQVAEIMRAAIRPENAPPTSQVQEFRYHYSRRHLTHRLADWFDELTSSSS